MAVYSGGNGLLPILHLQSRAFLYSLGMRRGSGLLRVIGIGALVAFLAIMVVIYLLMIGFGMVAAGSGSAIPAFATLIGSLAAVFLVFVKAPGTVFGCTDYDLVAALPVPMRTVVLARTAPLYGFSIALSVLPSVPLYVAYFSSVPVSPLAVVAAVICTVLAPLAPAAVATLISLGLTSVAVRFRHAGVVQLVLSALAVAAVLAGTLILSRAALDVDNAAALAAIGNAADALSLAVTSAYPPAAWAVAAIRDGSVAGLLGFAALSLALPVSVTLLLAMHYPSVNAIATSSPRRSTRSVTATRGAASPLCALTVKELRCIGSIPSHALNNCAGLLLMVVMAIAVAVLDVDALPVLGIDVQIEALMPWAFGFCGAMSLTAGPSVSLEARASWLMLTVPVSAGTVLGSKLLANFILGGAATLISAIVLVAGGIAPLLVLQCVVAAMGMLVSFASIALAIDATRPNFAWTTPTEVIKRGLPMIVGAFGGALSVLGFGYASLKASDVLGLVASVAINLCAPAACALVGLIVLRAVIRRGLPGPGWAE